MIFIARKADFSAKNIGKVDYAYDNSEGDDGVTVLINSITIEQPTNRLYVGSTTQLNAIVFPLNAYMRTDLEWVSSDESKAVVSQSGVLKVLDVGNVIIYAKAKDGSLVQHGVNLTLTARTTSDRMAETNAILQYYSSVEMKNFTETEMIALDTLLARIGIKDANSVWSKIKYLMLPCLGSSVNNAFINIINGEDLSSYTKSGINVKSAYSLKHGWIVNNSTYTDKVEIPTALSNSNEVTKSINNGFFYLVGGSISLKGGSRSWGRIANPLLMQDRVGISRAANLVYTVDFNSKTMRGVTTDLTEQGTYHQPYEKIKTEELTDWDNVYATITGATWYLSDGSLNVADKSQGFCVYAYGDALTDTELRTLYTSLNKFFIDLGIDPNNIGQGTFENSPATGSNVSSRLGSPNISIGTKQGMLYSNGEIYQFAGSVLSGNTTPLCSVIDSSTMAQKRTITMPVNTHYGSNEWIDKDNKIFATANDTTPHCIYIIDMHDENNITYRTIDTSSVNNITSNMQLIAYDKQNKVMYLCGYKSSDNINTIVVNKLDFADIVNNNGTTFSVLDTFEISAKHMQDGAFYNGKIYIVVDNTANGSNGNYDATAVMVVNPTSKTMEDTININLGSVTTIPEAQGLAVNEEGNYLIVSNLVNGLTYYKLNV